MKLLGELHGKFRLTNSECLKEFAPQWTSSNSLLPYPKSHHHVNSYSKEQGSQPQEESFACLDAASADGEHVEDRPSVSLSELLHGFHTFRIHGKDLVITGLATPKFSTSIENIMQNETRTTEDQLKLVKIKLEKMLSAERKEYDHNHTSWRESFNYAEKSRHGSTTTYSGGNPQATNNENEAIANPLKHYIFGSEVEPPETTIVKDHRSSLWELFQKTKKVDAEPKSNIGMQKEKKTDKSSVHLMKKILKRRILHSRSQCSTAASVGTIDSTSADERLHKILRMLHRIYPEASAISQKSQNMWKYVTKNNFTNEDRYINRNQMRSEDTIIIPYRAISEMSASHTKNNMSLSTHGEGDTSWNREYWIKSDAEYVILEL